MRKVRRAELSDFSSLARLYVYLNPSTPVLENPKAPEIWSDILANPNVAVFVAVLGGELVASCTLITAPNLMRQGTPNGFLENVVTHGDHRRQGHGRAVTEAALGEAWERGCTEVALFTGRARANPSVLDFYAKCGLREEGKAALIAQRPIGQGSS